MAVAFVHSPVVRSPTWRTRYPTRTELLVLPDAPELAMPVQPAGREGGVAEPPRKANTMPRSPGWKLGSVTVLVDRLARPT